MNIPRSVNTQQKLDYLISYIWDHITNSDRPLRIIFYSPWEKASKIKGYDIRVNLWEVPAAFSVLKSEFVLQDNLSYNPTLLVVDRYSDGKAKFRINDNKAAINYELASI